MPRTDPPDEIELDLDLSPAAESLRQRLDDALTNRELLDEHITRLQGALDALTSDDMPVRRRARRNGAPTARSAVLAALASFSQPVSTQTLLDHDDLVHYSRQTLRSALADLHQQGQVHPASRTPHGYIWQPNR